MIFKKISWVLKRHPFLYKIRFKLLSRNSSTEGIREQAYNKINKKKDIPKVFYETNEMIFCDSKPKTDLEKAKKICLWLQDYLKAGPGLSETSKRTLEEMLAGKGGVCSDMSQIFNNFCLINDIQVREWGVTRGPFDKTYGGHSFNEIYCNEFKKWVLFDSYWCLFFRNKKNEPLSVSEFYQSVRNGNENIKIERFKKVPFLKIDGFKKNYFHLNNIPFLICNYSNKRYDTLLKYTKPRIPIFMSHFFLYVLNKSYYYKFPFDDYRKIFS